jgi:hypothetical protein
MCFFENFNIFTNNWIKVAAAKVQYVTKHWPWHHLLEINCDSVWIGLGWERVNQQPRWPLYLSERGLLAAMLSAKNARFEIRDPDLVKVRYL